jgi:uncharacterized protein Yka (UPF0111/DUF47 family)
MELVDVLRKYLEKGEEVRNIIKKFESMFDDITKDLYMTLRLNDLFVGCYIPNNHEDIKCIMNFRDKYIIYVEPYVVITIDNDRNRSYRIPEEVLNYIKENNYESLITNHINELMSKLDEHLKKLKTLSLIFEIMNTEPPQLVLEVVNKVNQQN